MGKHDLNRDLVQEALQPYENLERKLPPRSTAKTIGVVALVLAGVGTQILGVAGGAMTVDIGSAKLVWPDNETNITLVEGAEEIPEGGEEWVVFGGLGQVNSKAAAEQFFEAKKAAGELEAVASVQYKNQGVDASDAEVLKEFITNRNVKRIGIVGVSMGLSTGLDWFHRLIEIAKEEGIDVEWKIEDVVAYSSPADRQDPWKSDLLHKAAATNYPGGLYTKFGYNADWGRIFAEDSTDVERDMAIDEALRKTFNECSPALFMSQVNLLDETNPARWQEFKDYFAKNATFTYMIGEYHDDTVDAEQAANKYFVIFGVLIGTTWRLIRVVGAGHADTIRSALTLEDIYKAEVEEPILLHEGSYELHRTKA